LEKLSQEHINKAMAKFIKRLTSYMAVAANDGSFQVSIILSSPTNRLFPKLTRYQQTIGEDYARNAEKW